MKRVSKFFKLIVNSDKWIYLLMLVSLIVSSCATPIAPTGGEPDRSGPKLLSTSPVTGTVNFSGNEVRFNFEDWVDRASFQRALSIEPGLNLDYDIKWRRKTAIIRLNNPLPDSTTVIFSLDKELRDTRSNRISEPIKIALSTGNVIDQESVVFRVISAYPSANKTEPVVLLYRDPFDINEPAFYSSSADTSGVIRFSYLAEGEYRAILVHDINRNRTWDREREFAQPMHTEYFKTTEIDTSDFIPFYYAKRDTTRPFTQNVGLFSENRLRIQFSKPIPYQPDNVLTLSDSLDQQIQAYHMYNDSREQSVAFFQTETPLTDAIFYLISGGDVQDANGNQLRFGETRFEGSSEPDTTILRYIAPFGGEALSGRDSLYIRYSTQINNPTILDSLKIFVNREDARNDFTIEVNKNRLIVSPNLRWNSANAYQIRTWDPSLAAFKDVRIQTVDDQESGDLTVVMADSLNIGKDIQMTLFLSSGAVYRQEIFKDSLSLMGLRPGTYHLLLHESNSQTNLIDYGSVDPFSPPGFIYADPRFPIRARMSSELILD
jgi:hypothetical protein